MEYHSSCSLSETLTAVEPLGSGVWDLNLDQPFALHHGGSLPHLRARFRICGRDGAPVAVVLGGISADAMVCGDDLTGRAGWWPEIVGRDQVIDSRRYRILSFDYLGGNGATSGPRESTAPFPAISTADQATVLGLILDSLAIDQVHALVGASYGAMVSLAFAARYPNRTSHLAMLGGADCSAPMATAWRTVQRQLVRFGIRHGLAAETLALARALAMTTYRSAEEFAVRFSGEPVRGDRGLVFPVEQYLMARGASFALGFDPRAFLCLCESLDLHRVDPAQVTAATILIAFSSDLLVPPESMRLLAQRIAGPVSFHELVTPYGHDAFLKDAKLLIPILEEIFKED